MTKITMVNYVATRSLLYYIPKSVDLKKPTTVVIYLHGGNSNMDQSRSEEVAETLFWARDGLGPKEGIKSIADASQFIVVMPTTTTGWNEFTPFYMRELLTLIRKELNPNPNKIFLAGHSMGAMGISRSANKLGDEFAMFMPISGGFQPHLKTLEEVGPLFNTKVWVTAGLKYEFTDFLSWNYDFDTFIKEKSVTDHFKVGPADWTFEPHDLTHNPNIPFLTKKFEKFTKEVSRNLYRPHLFGKVWIAKTAPGYIVKNEMKKYFWLEALSFREMVGTETSVSMSFRLYSEDNEINIYLDRPVSFLYDTKAHLKEIRLHLSEQLFDFDQPLKVNLITLKGVMEIKSVLFEGYVKRDPSASQKIMKETHDKGFVFESFLDLTLPNN